MQYFGLQLLGMVAGVTTASQRCSPGVLTAVYGQLWDDTDYIWEDKCVFAVVCRREVVMAAVIFHARTCLVATGHGSKECL